MDTAQRGMGLTWPVAQELIRGPGRGGAEGGRLACGAGTDQLDPGAQASLDRVRDAYGEQIELIESGGRPWS